MSTEKKIYMSTDYTGEAIAPHQYFVTDADGKALWEDRLAYEASTEEVILPDTTVNNIAYGRTWISCPNASKIQIGNTGTFYIDGKGYPYVAIEYSNSSWPSISVQLKLDGKSGLMAVDGNKLMFYDILVTPPGLSGIISIVNNSTTLKTIDPKYLPSGIGKPGVIYLPEFMGATSYKAYRDTGLTEQMTYAEAKEQLLGGALILQNASGTTSYYTPLRITLNEDAKTIEFTIHIPMSVYVCTMTFSDTPES